tara:strand:- start:14 stop:343 length:330 start_codon:yes stop_codon:yes gene_type:complete
MNESLSSYVLASFSAGMAATFLVAYLALRFYGNKEEHSDRVERQRDKADMQILLNSYRAVESDAELNLAISACWRSGIPATPENLWTKVSSVAIIKEAYRKKSPHTAKI